MNSYRFLLAALFTGLTLLLATRLQAQQSSFTNIARLPNGEILLRLTAPTGFLYRVESANNPTGWAGLVTLPSTASPLLEHTDSATPYLDARLYRAYSLSGSNLISGDHLVTTNGDVIIQPRYHATFVMSWNGRMIYVDPDEAATYSGLPKADVILVTHSHQDHFNTATIDQVRGSNAVIIGPQEVYNALSAPQKAIARVLSYGVSTNVFDLTVQAVHAYNSFHALGFANGYVLTIGGRRIYISGDTGNTTEMQQLTGIDVAFLCMNQPFTMTVNEATNAVSRFLPKVVYPYHYRDSSGAATNAAYFKQRLSTQLGIEVRLRKWY